MKAMILAAGVGSRLSPITDVVPKPLIPVLGKPVLSRIIDLLEKHGFNQFIANTHYLGEKIQDYYLNNAGGKIKIVHEEELSGVAGGIRACADFLREGHSEGNRTFAIIMGDAITDIDLSAMLASHKSSGRLATIAVKQVDDTSQFGVVSFDSTNKVISFQEKPKKEQALSNWANTGVYLFEPAILDWIPSIVEAPTYDVAHDLFPNLLNNNIELNVFTANHTYWADLGTHAQYRQTLFDALNGALSLNCEGQKYSWGYLGEGTKMSAGCFIKGKAYIGKNCYIGRCIMKGNVVIEDNCIIEDGTVIQDSLILSGAIIRNGCRIREMNIKPGDDIYPVAEPMEDAIVINPISGKSDLNGEKQTASTTKDEKVSENSFLSFVNEAAERFVKIFQ
jgi:mannose-1-phosphate guanylyltransferase/mannose-1-phosphate guanylyltransferase/phosphomannomutase